MGVNDSEPPSSWKDRETQRAKKILWLCVAAVVLFNLILLIWMFLGGESR